LVFVTFQLKLIGNSKHKNMSSNTESPRNSFVTRWLMLYNTLMACVCTYMIFLAFNDPEKAQMSLFWAQSLAVLEIVHVALGFVRSSLIITSVQIMSRMFISYLILNEAQIRERAYPEITLVSGFVTMVINFITSSLTIVWGVADLVRYLRYVFPSVKIVKIARYTFFYVLYPLGAFLELVVAYGHNPYIGQILFVVYCIGFPKMYDYMIKASTVYLNVQEASYLLPKLYGVSDDPTESSQKILTIRFGSYFFTQEFSGVITVEQVRQNMSSILSCDRQMWRDIEHDGYSISSQESCVIYPWTVCDNLTISKNSTASVKDLGPQVGWGTVYLLEYLGPIIICLASRGDEGLELWRVLWVGHYVKRIFETLTIHTFSRATMPLTSLGRNCAYYWGTALLMNNALSSGSAFTNTGDIVVSAYIDSYLNVLFTTMFVFAELGNLYCHYYLYTLRSGNVRSDNFRNDNFKSDYVLPDNFLFRLVVSPNYMFELMVWVAFTLLTRSVAVGLFAFVGGAQMYQWALDKKKRNRKLFGNAYKTKYALIPYLL
ncbi:hypothetical protein YASMINEVIRUS_205, partial [Yasminevirus sp. GU-2018]